MPGPGRRLTDRASGSKERTSRPRLTTLRTTQPHLLEMQASFLTPIFEAEVRAGAARGILLCWEERSGLELARERVAGWKLWGGHRVTMEARDAERTGAFQCGARMGILRGSEHGNGAFTVWVAFRRRGERGSERSRNGG